MLSIKRLTWIISIALFISLLFLLINFQESTHDEVNIVNEQYQIQELLNMEEEPEEISARFVLVTSDSDNLVYVNIKKQLEDWGIAFLTTDHLVNYDTNKKVIYVFCEDEVSKTTDLVELVSYVEQGGRVLFASGIAEGNVESYLNPIFGIVDKAYKVTGNVFSFSDGFLPFQEEEMYYAGFNSSTWLQLQDKAKIYVEDVENETPLIYSYPYGNGKTLVVNATFLEDVSCMGMFAGLLSNEIDGFVYPVYNTKSFFLDNFPVVTYIDDEVCLALYGRTTDDFVENVVWPVFQRVAVQEEIKYTSSVMTAGSGDPYFPDLDASLFYTMGRSALIYEGELIASADFSKEGEIVENQAFYDEFSVFFPEYEIQALAITSGNYRETNVEEIKVLRGYMFGDEESMFLCEPSYEKGMYQFPVMTDGIVLDSGNMFTIAMQISSMGILSQRIDINTLIADENEQPVWDEDKILFANYEERVIDIVDWMESVTLSETANYIHGYSNMYYEVSYEQDKILINCSNYRKGQVFYLHLPYEIEDVKGADIEEISGDYYLIQVYADQIEINYDGKAE